MPVRYSRHIPFISLIGDFALLNFLFVVRFCQVAGNGVCLTAEYLLFFTYLNLAWLILVVVFGAHKINRNTRKKSILSTYVKIIVFFFFIFLMFFQITPFEYFPRWYISYLFVSFFVLLMVWKFGLYYAFLLYRKWGFNYRNVIILGDSNKTKELARFFQTNKWHGYRFLGFFDGKTGNDKHNLGHWNDLANYLENNDVHEIYIALEQVPTARMSAITELIAEYPVKVRIVPDLGNFSFKSAELIQYGTLPVIKIHPGPLSYWYNRFVKRLVDVILSLFVIVFVLSWLTVLLFVIQLFGSREGIFFKQQRTCIDGEVFTCLKFRSMCKNKDADNRQALPGDNRVTPLGRFLRKFSIDELPQFFNVLVGHMSVAGPRPHMLKHTDEYRNLVKRFMLRHTVKPGITGLAQVNGYRGPIISRADIRERVKYDVHYIENWSINMDIKIMLLTLVVILKGIRAC